jgi:hypothetical protein
VVFDPIDIQWGLRLVKNGKDKGLSVVVFGLAHADIPLTQGMEREIAHAVVQGNVSCVISTFGMSGDFEQFMKSVLSSSTSTLCKRLLPLTILRRKTCSSRPYT